MSGIEITRNTSAYAGRGPRGYWWAQFGPFGLSALTKTAARDAILTVTETAITGSFEPAMFTYGGAHVLVYRQIDGWYFKYWTAVSGFAPSVGACAAGTDRDGAIRSARMYLVQCAYPSLNGLDFLMGDAGAIADHCRWLCFNRAYESARKNAGLLESECHRFAGDQSSATSRWLTEPERMILDTANKV